MSFFSSSANLPSQKKKGMLDDPNRNSTNEQARPLTYLAGWQRVGITWLDDPHNQKSVPVKGGGKGSMATGYKYYADMLAIVCLGPVDAVTHVIMDNEVKWTGVINRGNEQSVTINLGKKGSMVLFWGTEGQDFYPPLQALGHPPYKGQCYAYFPKLYFGQGRTNAPNIELGIRRVVSIPWLGVLPNNADDANPVAVLADLLTNPLYGAGLDASLIDQPQWLATAQQVSADDAVCSPLITDATGVRQLMTQVLEYFYGYLRWTNDNLLQIGLFRDPPTDLTNLTKLTASHLTEPPDIDTNEWSGTYNRTVVNCVERTRYWQDDYGQWYDDGNYAITGQTLLQSLDRKWITRRDQADKLARRAGKQYALPQFTGTLKCRRSAVSNVLLGDWLVLDYDPVELGFALVLQCTAITQPGDSSEEIELEVAGQQVTTDPRELYDREDVINHDPGSADVQPLALWRVLELPRALHRQAADPYVTLLAVRGGFETVGAYLFDSPDDISYDLLATVTDFAWGGNLVAEYPDNTDNVDLTVGMVVDLVGPDLDLPVSSDNLMKNNKFLIFAGDEIIAVRSITVLTATRVKIFGKRGRFDTRPLDHPVGEAVFLIRRRDIARLNQDTFSDDLTEYFKPVPFSPGQQFDISLVPAQQLAFVGRAMMPQAFTALSINGSASDPATFAAGQDIVFGWTLATNETFGTEVPDEDYYGESGIHAFLAIYNSASDLTRQKKLVVDPGLSTVTLSHADLVAAFDGAEPASFYVRLWSKKAGRRSYGFEQATVNRN